MALCPSTTVKGLLPCTTPQGQTPGHPTSGEGRGTSCGQISQLEVCQLLSTSPQVLYPVGLNGHDEPIVTTLPEPLSRGVSVIARKHLYLGINIPSLPMEEIDHKALSIGEASSILVTSLPKSPPKFKGTMTAEVNDLLS